ncbi:MAG: TIM barrel protein [Verrucomicrobia bacterium]|nr:TIM barrel protein [Verrucomicrobiota bacterium]
MMWRKSWLAIFQAIGLGATVFAADPTPPTAALPNPFFAMDTGTRDAAHATIESQVTMIKGLGFSGFGPTWTNPQEVRSMLTCLDQHALKMYAIYIGLNIDAGKGAVTPQLKEAIQTLRGRETMLWLHVQSNKYKPSSPEGDEAAMEALSELADLAQAANLKIALYPHAGCWVERVDDGVRLAQKIGRKNLGVTFNLCHWLKVDGKDLESTLKLAVPCLFVATINGADQGGKDWSQLIQPLDQGSYDVSRVLSCLIKLGYTGPIGLQHYGIGGSAEANLKRSMSGWQRLSAKAIAEAGKPAKRGP